MIVDHAWKLTKALSTGPSVLSQDEDVTTIDEHKEREKVERIDKEKRNLREAFLRICLLIFHNQTVVTHLRKSTLWMSQGFAKLAGYVIGRRPDAAGVFFPEFLETLETRLNVFDMSQVGLDFDTIAGFLPVFQNVTLMSLTQELLRRSLRDVREHRKEQKPGKSKRKSNENKLCNEPIMIALRAVDLLCDRGVLVVQMLSPESIETLFEFSIDHDSTSEGTLVTLHKLLIRILHVDQKCGSRATSHVVTKLLTVGEPSGLELVSKLICCASSLFRDDLVDWCTKNKDWLHVDNFEKYWHLMKDVLQQSSSGTLGINIIMNVMF